MTTRPITLAALGGLLALLSTGHAQQPGGFGKKSAAPSAPHDQRAVYAVKHGDATALADVLSKHFKGDALVSALPGNTLLVSGTQQSTAEVVKLLDQFDRKPRSVEVEVVLAEVAAGKGEDGKGPPELPESAAEVLAKVAELNKAGPGGAVQRIKLTAVEGQPVTSTTSGSKPVVTSTNLTPTGAVQQGVSYHPVGTTIKFTAWGGADNSVAVDLDLKDSRISTPEAPAKEAPAKLPEPREKKEEKKEPREDAPKDAPKFGKGGFGGFPGPDKKGGPEPRVRPAAPLTVPSFETTTLVTKLTVPVGRAVTAQAVRTDGKAGRTVLLVVVTARVVEAGPRDGK